MIKYLDVVWLWLFTPLAKALFSAANHKPGWVIGGHGGKLYADNSAAIHQYVTEMTDQKIVWITRSKKVYAQLRTNGHIVCWKNSLKARFYILNAEVVIQSHGHADVDSILGRNSKFEALVIHVNHCMNFIKAGQLYNPSVDFSNKKLLGKIKKKLPKFDYLLACSDWERENFQKSFPHEKEKIILGGGAHLDQLINSTPQGGAVKRLLYFPTWRDKCEKPKLEIADVIESLFNDAELLEWLDRTGYVFTICGHINFKERLANRLSRSRIDVFPPDSVVDLLVNCELLISDYSGLIMDALYLDKPVVFFPFDISDFLKCRHLYVDYEDFAFGPLAKSMQDLKQILISESWKDTAKFQEKRKSTSIRAFNYEGQSYAERSYNAIQALLRGDAPRSVQ